MAIGKVAAGFTTISEGFRLLGASFAFAALGAGCSSLAYQPTHHVYADPKKGGYDYEQVEFSSTDGTKLTGWFFPARLEPGQKAPRGTFVQFHGNGQNMTAHFASLFWAADAGYNFFTFDYRGYGASEGSPSQEGVYHDALAAIAYVQKRVPAVAGAAPDLVFYGQSLGGAVLMRAYPDLVDKTRVKYVVIDSSFPSYRSAARDILSRHWLTFIFQPLGWLVMSDAYAPEDWIEKISPTPLLVIHGDKDQVIPLKFGQKVFALAKEPKTFWLVHNGEHIDSMVRHRGRYREKLIELLEGRPRPSGAPVPDDSEPAPSPSPSP